MTTNTQSASPTVLKSYLVSADLRFEGADAAKEVDFLVSAESGKGAWVEARRITRIGGKVKSPEGAELVQLAAGLYTVRDVKSLDKSQPKPKVLTVEQLIEAAKAENLTVPKKLLELIERLRAPAAAADEQPDALKTENEAA